MCSDHAAFIRDAVCRNKNQELSRLKNFPPYFLLSAGDGWVEQSLWIKTYEIGSILFHIELPGWLPLEFPWTLVAKQGNIEVASLVVHSPGTYAFKLPVSGDAKIKLAANQWFVPRDLEVSPDDRNLSFRIIDHMWEASH
jgi:hypothetical protein